MDKGYDGYRMMLHNVFIIFRRPFNKQIKNK